MTDPLRKPAADAPLAAFVLVALALAAGTMGATMASPLFPQYEHDWQLLPSTLTAIYVSYMFGVLGAFLFLGRLSDHVGPHKVLRLGLACIIIGLGVSAAAPGVLTLIAARVVVGIASGLITTSATIALVRQEPRQLRGRAPLVASVTTMAGFGLGPFVAGLIAQFAPAPLVLPYVAIMALTGLILAGLAKTRGPAHATPSSRLSLAPRLTLPEPASRAAFLAGAFGVFTAYALFSLLASLAPSFLRELLPWHGPAVSGTAIAAVLFCSSTVQLPARALPPRISLRAALGIMVGGLALLAASLGWHQAALFLAADLAIGMGHGLAFMSGMAMVNRIATEQTRAGILASFLSIGYLGTIVPILAVGWLADHVGLIAAVIAFCAAMSASSAALFLFSVRAYRTPRKPTGLPSR